VADCCECGDAPVELRFERDKKLTRLRRSMLAIKHHATRTSEEVEAGLHASLTSAALHWLGDTTWPEAERSEERPIGHGLLSGPWSYNSD
jgi:hypothetical protein